jgi:tetratricopeptide (TPR) repeat protein
MIMGLMDEGLESYEHGRKALRACEKILEKNKEALEKNKDNPYIHQEIRRIYLQIGLTHYAIGEYPEALCAFEKALEENKEALKENKNDPSIHLQIGSIHLQIGLVHYAIGEYREALCAFEESLRYKKNSYAYNLMGCVHYTIGEFSEALKAFEKATKFDSKNIVAFYHMYLINDQLENQSSDPEKKRKFGKGANEAYKNATQIDIENKSIHKYFYEAISYQYFYEKRSKENDKAEKAKESLEKFDKCLNTAFDLTPKTTIDWYYKGLCLIQKNYNTEALEAFEEALKINPNYAHALYDKGVTLRGLAKLETCESAKSKLYKRAIEAFNTATQINCRYQVAWHMKGIALNEFANFKSDLYFKKISEESTNSLFLKKREIDKNYLEAIEAIDKAIKSGQEKYYFWYDKGLSLFCLNRFEEAIEAFENVLNSAAPKDEPSRKMSRTMKADALLNLCKYNEVINFLDRDIDHDALYYKGRAFYKNGRYSDAIGAFNEFLKNDKWNKDEQDKDQRINYIKFFLGLSYNCLGKYEDAINCFNEVKRDAKSEDNYYKQALYNKGISYYEQYRCYKDNEIPSTDNSRYAEFEFENAIKKDPNYTEALYYKGLLSDRLNKKHDAIQLLKRALRSKPASADGYILKGIILTNIGRYNDSIDAFERATIIEPKEIRAWNNKGAVFHKLENYIEAINCFNIALGINSRDGIAWNGKGLSLFQLKKYSQAHEAFERAAEIYNENLISQENLILPKSSIILNKIGEVKNFHEFSKFQRYRESQIYSEIIDICIEYGEALYNQGLTLSKLVRYKDAIKKFKESICVFDGILEPTGEFPKQNRYKRTVKTPSKNEHIEESKIFDKIIELKSKFHDQKYTGNAEAWNGKGLIYLEMGWNLEAKKAFEEAINAFKNPIKAFGEANNSEAKLHEACSFKGISLYKIKENKKSIESFNEAITRDSPCISALNNKGLVLQEQGHFEEAIESFTRVLEIVPRDLLARTNLIKLYLKSGDITNASKKIKETLLLNLYSADIFCLKGQVEIEESKIDSAIDSFKKAISLDQSNPYHLLWSVYARYLNIEFSSERSQDCGKQTHEVDSKNENEISRKVSKEQQEKLLSVIRDLERFSIPYEKPNHNSKLSKTDANFILFLKNKDTPLDIFYNRQHLGLFSAFSDYNQSEPQNMTNCLIKNYSTSDYEIEQQKNWKEIAAYKSYFLGCFYYKIGDIFTSYEKLKECTELKPKIELEKPANLLAKNIWRYQIKPSWWEWWTDSPVENRKKEIIFYAICGIIFVIFLPLFSNNIVNVIPLLSNIFVTVFHQLVGIFHSPEPFTQSNNSLSNNSLSNNSLFAIDWKENSIPYTIFLTFLSLILLIPNIERIIGKDISIELQHSTPPLEFFPNMPPRLSHDKYPAIPEIIKMDYNMPSELKKELEYSLRSKEIV